MIPRTPILAGVALTVLLGLGIQRKPAFAQNVPSNTVSQDEGKFKNAQNRWMLTPVDVRTQEDTATPAERQGRDKYWDSLIGASAPLSQPDARALGPWMVDSAGPSPEFANLRVGAWVIGKFEGYRTYLSSSQRSVYTEIDLRIEHVFGHPGAPGLSEGAVIAVDRLGGTILAPWGSIISYYVQPEEYDFQPNHRYLIVLHYRPEGNFLIASLFTSAKSWDLTDGTVKPGNDLEARRARRGESEINGMKVSDLIHLLDKKFEEHYRKERQ